MKDKFYNKDKFLKYYSHFFEIKKALAHKCSPLFWGA